MILTWKVSQKPTTQDPTKGWQTRITNLTTVTQLLYVCTCTTWLFLLHTNILQLKCIWFMQTTSANPAWWSVVLFLYPAFNNMNLSKTVLVVFVNLQLSDVTHICRHALKTMPYLYTPYLSVLLFRIYIWSLYNKVVMFPHTGEIFQCFIPSRALRHLSSSCIGVYNQSVCVCVCSADSQASPFMNVDFYITLNQLRTRCVEPFSDEKLAF